MKTSLRMLCVTALAVLLMAFVTTLDVTNHAQEAPEKGDAAKAEAKDPKAEAKKEEEGVPAEIWKDFMAAYKASRYYAYAVAFRADTPERKAALEQRFKSLAFPRRCFIEFEYGYCLHSFEPPSGSGLPSEISFRSKETNATYYMDSGDLGRIENSKEDDREYFYPSKRQYEEINHRTLCGITLRHGSYRTFHQVSFSSTPADQILKELCDEVGLDYVLGNPTPATTVTLNLSRVNYLRAISMVCEAAGWGVRYEDDHYKNQEFATLREAIALEARLEAGESRNPLQMLEMAILAECDSLNRYRATLIAGPTVKKKK